MHHVFLERVSVVFGHIAPYLSSPTKGLYKRCGTLDDQITLLRHKFLIQQSMTFNGKRTKTATSQEKKFQVSMEQEANVIEEICSLLFVFASDVISFLFLFLFLDLLLHNYYYCTITVLYTSTNVSVTM